MLAAFAAALTLAASPAGAAVIQSGATTAVFGSELRFVPFSAPELRFDSSLGTLNGVTLSFDGTMTASIGTRVADAPPFPSALTAEVRVTGNGRTVAALDPISVPVTFTERTGTDSALFPYGVEGSATVAASFQVALAGGADGLLDSFNTDFRFLEVRPSFFSTATDAIFRGGVTALFDYTPLDGDVAVSGGAAGGATNVPEPASFAVLGLGLAGLVAARRRAG